MYLFSTNSSKMGKKIILSESQFRMLVNALYESYSMVSYTDVYFDIMECFKDVDEDLLRRFGDNFGVRIKYRYTSAQRSSDYDVPDSPASYEYIDCEALDKNLWNALINESGLPEEELKADLEEYAIEYLNKIEEKETWERE